MLGSASHAALRICTVSDTLMQLCCAWALTLTPSYNCTVRECYACGMGVYINFPMLLILVMSIRVRVNVLGPSHLRSCDLWSCDLL